MDTNNQATRQDEDPFARQVDRAERRKLKGRQERNRSPWFWAGMFGLVGWSVAVPTVIGLYAGIRLDQRYPGRASWTLTGLILGLALGCLNAWMWIRRETRDDDHSSGG